MPTSARPASLDHLEPHLRLVPPLPALRAVDPVPSGRSVESQAPNTVSSEGCPRLAFQAIGRIAVIAYEVTEGIRQVSNLGRWITPEVASQLSAVRALNVERRSLYRDVRRAAPTVRCVRANSPAPGVIEATVVLNTPSKARGVALRFEFRRGLWKASVLAVM